MEGTRRNGRLGRALSVVAPIVVGFAPPARGEAEPPALVALPPPPPPPAPPPPKAADTGPKVKLTPTGYVEAYYAYNFGRPGNGITNFRGFDNRHDSVSLTNAALGGDFAVGPVSGRLVFQIGSTPSSYYLAEPTLPGTSSTNPSNGELWKYLQEAFVGYKAPIGRGLDLKAGLFMSPIGFESFAVRENWNWSRSNLFFGLPYYHAGARATYPWSDELSTTVSVFNGWNSVVDNNAYKSVQADVTYEVPDKISLTALYFGGVERPTGAPEGPWVRHHFDGVAQVDFTRWLSVAAQGDIGFEPNRLGTARWFSGALYTRFRPTPKLALSLRADRFHERLAASRVPGEASAPIFWGGAEWVSSGTATVDVRPHENLSVRLELRHDVASAPLYFKGSVEGDGSAERPYVANARTQDTLLLGATAWF